MTGRSGDSEAYGSASLAMVINSRVTETCLYTGMHICQYIAMVYSTLTKA